MNAHALKPEGGKIASDLAQRHGFSIDAVTQMLGAVFKGNGRMAQFDHPEFGRLGQWLRGGLLMQGEMVNQELKRRVDALCNEISEIFENQPGRLSRGSFQAQNQGGNARQVPAAGTRKGQSSLFRPDPASNWWPHDLGDPNATGSQNSVQYAYFSRARRLAVRINSEVRVYDTLNHQIDGFSQQQGSDGSILFTSQYRTVNLSSLPVISQNGQPFGKTPESFNVSDATTGSSAASDVFAILDRLGSLKTQGVLTDEEFSSKKAELLSRL